MTQANINAVICELSIGVWTARKLDKAASREVKHSNGANSDDAARVNKNLMAGMDNLKKVTEFVGSIRTDFYAMTLPWSDSGQRLVPMAQFFELKQWLNDKDNEYRALVDNFLYEYPNLISAQAFQLGDLFNRNEYPTADEIRGKFRFSTCFLPLPTAGDFRVDCVQEVKDEMANEYEQILMNRINSVSTDLWDRLHTTLKHMSERLGYDELGKAKVFRDTLVDNAVDLCDLLKKLNITNDPKLESARKELESTLLGVDAGELRRTGAREEVKARIDRTLDAWF